MNRKAMMILVATLGLCVLLFAQGTGRDSPAGGAEGTPWCLPWWLLIVVPLLFSVIAIWTLVAIGFLQTVPYETRVLGYVALGTLVAGAGGGITISILGEDAAAKWGSEFTMGQTIIAAIAVVLLGGYRYYDRHCEHKEALSFGRSTRQREVLEGDQKP